MSKAEKPTVEPIPLVTISMSQLEKWFYEWCSRNFISANTADWFHFWRGFKAHAAITVEPEVAYMAVPRCDQCRLWAQTDPRGDPHGGHCTIIQIDPKGRFLLATTANFGCVKFERK